MGWPGISRLITLSLSARASFLPSLRAERPDESETRDDAKGDCRALIEKAIDECSVSERAKWNNNCLTEFLPVGWVGRERK